MAAVCSAILSGPISADLTAWHADWTLATFAIVLGIALLTYGRKLYWLALGGIGFFLGLWISSRLLPSSSGALALGLAFLGGILGAWLAILAQKFAIGLGGFLVGGAGSFWLATEVLAPALRFQSQVWVWVIAALGAMIGVSFAAVLFDASLIFLSSAVGALLVSSRSHLGLPQETWLFLLMLCLGVMTQSRGTESGKDDDD